MRTIETNAIITADNKLTVQVPSDIAPGEHQVVVVIDERPVHKEKRPSCDFLVIHVGSWPSHLSLRREDLYDERGR